MAPSTFAGSLPLVEPKLQHLFNIITRSLKIDVNCVKIGTIQSVDYTTMTATVQVVFQQQMRNGSYLNIPPLTDVPLFTLQGGGYSIQFPIASGDTAVLIFADRNIDNWFQAGGVQPPADGRLHSMSDCIAIVGLNSLASPIVRLAEGEAGLTDGEGTKVAMTGGKITVQNAGYSLLTVLTTLIQGIQGATAGGNPLVDTTGMIAEALVDLEALLY